jgi:hypothetical protein
LDPLTHYREDFSFKSKVGRKKEEERKKRKEQRTESWKSEQKEASGRDLSILAT